MPFFSDEFMDSLPQEPLLAAAAMCDEFTEQDRTLRTATVSGSNDQPDSFLSAIANFAANPEHVNLYIDALAAFMAYCESHGIQFDAPELVDDKTENVRLIQNFFSNVQSSIQMQVSRLTYERAKEHYSRQFSRSFVYEFSDGDITRLQEAINALRTLIADAHDLEEDHKRRLLARLERLQSELHKKMSDLDRFWGLIGDAGVVLGKLGEDAKPIIDRIKEIAQIVWRTQSRAEELPTDAKPGLVDYEKTDDC